MAFKIVKTGHVIEIYEYEKVPKIKDRKEKSKSKVDRSEDILSFSKNRARENLRRLINANFGGGTMFITLTYADNVTDLDWSNREFKKFIQRINRRYKDIDVKYCAVIEYQQRGAIHYHMLCNLPIVWQNADQRRQAERDLAAIWGHGFVDIQATKTWEDCDNVGAYLLKYMQKDVGSHAKGKQSYLHSRNLVKPEVIDAENIQMWLDTLSGHYPVFTSTYNGDFFGEVKYKEYNLKRG